MKTLDVLECTSRYFEKEIKVVERTIEISDCSQDQENTDPTSKARSRISSLLGEQTILGEVDIGETISTNYRNHLICLWDFVESVL